MSSLEARGIVAGYGERMVLRGCDLAIGSGEIVCIVGPNGAGKSTLLRVLAGLIRPRAGTVTIDHVDIASLTRSEVARRIAVVPQLLETIFPFTVREIVALGRTARLGIFGRVMSRDVTAIDDAIETLALGPLADQRIDALSGGERQRTVLAMAFAQGADILLLDEPTSHLDLAHQIATFELVRRSVAKTGGLGVAVVHDLNLAAAFATRVVLVADGRVVRDGPPKLVLSEEVLVPVFGTALRVIPGDTPVVVPRSAGG